MRLLVVDDDRTILDLVKQILELTPQYEVVAVPSAMAALAEVEDAEDDFDCVLVDIQMPEVDGIQLVRMIRQAPGYGDVPIVMLTAMRDRRYLTQAFSAGATDYITKPFDFQGLRSRIPAARKLAIDKVRHRVQPLMAGEMKGMGETARDFRLNDPIPLDKLEGAIDYSEFENFVRQLTRRRLSNCTVFAVKIGMVKEAFNDCSSDAFRTLVRNAALAVQEILLQNKGILSYRGNGVFLCIPDERLGASWRDLQTALNERFNALHENAADLPIQLRIGDQTRFKTNSFVRVLETLSAAVESAETRSLDLGDVPKAPNRFLALFGFTEEERHLEKRAYEEVLHTALAETADDDWRRRLERRQGASGRTSANPERAKARCVSGAGRSRSLYR